MASVDVTAVHRMTEALFIERRLRSPSSTRFWGLLVLASIIASAGVVGDSTATVIGAMIVAPLMTPILGSALALVLADRSQVVRCVLLVLGGALAVVAIGMLLGWIVSPPDAFSSNSQVSSRITPVSSICWPLWPRARSAPSRSSAPTSPTPCPGWRSRSRWCRPSR